MIRKTVEKRFLGMKRGTLRDISTALLIVSLVSYTGFKVQHPKQAYISPITQVQAEMLLHPDKYLTPIPTATPTPAPETPTQQSIDSEIKEVFGQYYPKAMLLLKGDGTPGACHENAGLDPLAFNDNGDSQDYGIFQINNKWQQIYNVNFLYDPHINIRIAWNIFKNNGYTFDRWTCGRYYGI